MLTISSQLVEQILKDNYKKLIANPQTPLLRKFNEGYMNNCLEISFPNRDGKFIIIVYNALNYFLPKHKAQLEQAYETAEILSRHGIPCRIPHKTDTGRHLIEVKIPGSENKHFFGIYNFLPGSTLPWEGWTRRHLRSLGSTMAKMHEIWKAARIDTQNLPEWNSYLNHDYEHLCGYFIKNAPYIQSKLSLKFDKEACDQLIDSIKQLSQSFESQLIHYDLVRGNVLFSDKKEKLIYPIIGIIDFEKVMLAPVIVDIARTLAFLIVDCKYKTENEISRYFFDEGCLAQSENQQAKKFSLEALKPLVLYFWLRDLWKFLLSNPYESLKENYHFNKTVEQLIKHKLITTTK